MRLGSLTGLDNPFWRFSVVFYPIAGAKEECLTLQDRFGIDVNVLLFAIWLGMQRGVALTESDVKRIDAEVEIWRTSAVQPLRQVRRFLGGLNQPGGGPSSVLKSKVAGAELHAEQIEQAILFGLAQERWLENSGSGSADAARANVKALMARHGGASFAPQNIFAALDQFASNPANFRT